MLVLKFWVARDFWKLTFSKMSVFDNLFKNVNLILLEFFGLLKIVFINIKLSEPEPIFL